MSPVDTKRIKHLLVLADAALDFEFVDIKLVNHFHHLREDLGLAKLLILIQQYAKEESQLSNEPPQNNQLDQNVL